MRLRYKDIERQQPIDMGAEQYLTDWYGPNIPYNFKDITEHLLRCIKNGVSEEEFKLYIHRKYLL